MYTLERILVTTGRIIQVLDVSDDKVSDLLPRYTSIKVILSNPDLDTMVIGELQDNQFIGDYVGTINELIRTNQITRVNLEVYESQEGTDVLYKTDVWERDFDVTPYDVFNLMEQEEDVRLYPDLKLSNGFIPAADMAKRYMVSVNGLIHPLASDDDGLYAIGANTNVRAKGQIEMSLLEFHDVGNLELISLNGEQRVDIHATDDLHQNGIYVRVGPEFRNKVVGLVLLGHLHLLDGTYSHFDTDIIHIDLKSLDIETKIINHHEALGLKNVGNYLKGGLGRVDIRNPSLIEYAIQNKSSFLFTLDTDRLYRLERPLNDEGLPCLYSTPTGLTGIAQYADGLLADYRQEYQDGLYCLQVPERPSTETLVKTTDYAAQGSSVRGTPPRKNASLPQLTAVRYLKTK